MGIQSGGGIKHTEYLKINPFPLELFFTENQFVFGVTSDGVAFSKQFMNGTTHSISNTSFLERGLSYLGLINGSVGGLPQVLDFKMDGTFKTR